MHVLEDNFVISNVLVYTIINTGNGSEKEAKGTVLFFRMDLVWGEGLY